MLNKIIQKGKEIAKTIVISLFFTSFLIFLISIPLKGKTDKFLGILNRMAIVEKNVEAKPTTIDKVKKRIKNFPAYGKVYATIKIPDISRELPLYRGDSLSILNYGVGHYTGSYFPGEGGTILVAAHNSDEYFGHIHELALGSEIIIETSYGTFTYEVVDGKVMNKDVLAKEEIQREEEILVMYTCYPPMSVGLTNDRYVVTAKLVGEDYE